MILFKPTIDAPCCWPGNLDLWGETKEETSIYSLKVRNIFCKDAPTKCRLIL